jgi:large subunit ribosomal protein L21
MPSYAIIETGGAQHRVEPGAVVRVGRVSGEPGTAVVFDRVLMIAGEDGARVGSPALDGARVRGTVVDQRRGPKVRIFTYKKRQNANRKTQGHRQALTTVKIDAIEG